MADDQNFNWSSNDENFGNLMEVDYNEAFYHEEVFSSSSDPQCIEAANRRLIECHGQIGWLGGNSSFPDPLKLQITPSFLKLIQDEVNKHYQLTAASCGVPATSDSSQFSPPPSEVSNLGPNQKLKAASFNARKIQIGSWERTSINQNGIMGKIYFVKKRMVWEILPSRCRKSKIEMQWSDIIGIKVTTMERQLVLQVELANPPSFHVELEPVPMKHTRWKQTSDFTDRQASTYRIHSLTFPLGVVNKHIQNLFNSEPRLLELSRQKFPTLSSPCFDNPSHMPTSFSFAGFNGGNQNSGVQQPLRGPTPPMLEIQPWISVNSSLPFDQISFGESELNWPNTTNLNQSPTAGLTSISLPMDPWISVNSSLNSVPFGQTSFGKVELNWPNTTNLIQSSTAGLTSVISLPDTTFEFPSIAANGNARMLTWRTSCADNSTLGQAHATNENATKVPWITSYAEGSTLGQAHGITAMSNVESSSIVHPLPLTGQEAEEGMYGNCDPGNLRRIEPWTSVNSYLRLVSSDQMDVGQSELDRPNTMNFNQSTIAGLPSIISLRDAINELPSTATNENPTMVPWSTSHGDSSTLGQAHGITTASNVESSSIVHPPPLTRQEAEEGNYRNCDRGNLSQIEPWTSVNSYLCLVSSDQMDVGEFELNRPNTMNFNQSTTSGLTSIINLRETNENPTMVPWITSHGDSSTLGQAHGITMTSNVASSSTVHSPLTGHKAEEGSHGNCERGKMKEFENDFSFENVSWKALFNLAMNGSPLGGQPYQQPTRQCHASSNVSKPDKK